MVAPSDPFDGGTVSSVISSSVSPSSRPAAPRLVGAHRLLAEQGGRGPHLAAPARLGKRFPGELLRQLGHHNLLHQRGSLHVAHRTARQNFRHVSAETKVRCARVGAPERRHAPKGGFVSNAGASAAFGGRICPRAPGRHEKHETRVHVRGTRVADHRRTGRRAERANRSSRRDDVAALLGLRTDVAVRDGAAVGRAGASRSGAAAAGRPARHDARSTARRSAAPPTLPASRPRCP